MDWTVVAVLCSSVISGPDWSKSSPETGLPNTKFEAPLEEKVETPLDKDDEPLEEGDRIWATGLFPEAEQIQATTSISQRLAEGFQ